MELLLIAILFFWVWRLQQQIDAFGGRGREHESSEGAKSVPDSGVVIPAQGKNSSADSDDPEITTLVIDQVSPREIVDSSAIANFDIAAWFARDWPLKTGALLVFLGFVWLVSYAFANDWIGAHGRVFLGLLAGVGVLVLGKWRILRDMRQGLVLSLLGSAIILATVYAGQLVYSFFPPVVAWSLGMCVMVWIGLLAVLHDRVALAVFGVIVGGIIPLLTNSGDGTILALFGHLLVVVVGVLWTVRQKGWRILIFVAMVVVFLYSLPFMGSSYIASRSRFVPSDFLLIQFFAITFVTIFYTSGIIGMLKTRTLELFDVVLSLLVVLMTLGWIFSLVSEGWQSLLCSIVGMFYVLGLYLIYRVTGWRQGVYLYAGASIVMFTAAALQAFDGVALVLVLTVMGLVLLTLMVHLFGLLRGYYFVGYLLLPFVLSFEYWDYSNWGVYSFPEELLALLLLTAGFVFSGSVLWSRWQKLPIDIANEQRESILRVVQLLFLLAAIYITALIWQFTQWSMDHLLARILSMVIYTLVGLSLYVSTSREERPVVFYFGLGLLVLVIARLLFVEVWIMRLAMRVVTFIGIGSMLIGSAFVKKKSV